MGKRCFLIARYSGYQVVVVCVVTKMCDYVQCIPEYFQSDGAIYLIIRSEASYLEASSLPSQVRHYIGLLLEGFPPSQEGMPILLIEVISWPMRCEAI